MSRSDSVSGLFPRVTPHGSPAIDESPFEAATSAMLSGLYGLFKGGTMYHPGHAQTAQQAQRFVAMIAPHFGALSTATQTIVFVGRQIVVNGAIARTRDPDDERLTYLSEVAAACGIGELSFAAGVTENDVTEMVNVVISALGSRTAIADQVLRTTRLVQATRRDDWAEFVQNIEYLRRYRVLCAFAEAEVMIAKSWSDADALGGLRQVACHIVDAFGRDASGMLGLTALRPERPNPAARALDVAIVGVATAAALGFDRAMAFELASALLLSAPRTATHPWWTAYDEAASAPSLPTSSLEDELASIVAFERQAPIATALPARMYGHEVQPHVATQILHVALAYVDLIHPSDDTSPLSPEIALQSILGRGTAFFDPHVSRALLSALSTWPPGTIVRLNSGDVAVVVRRAERDAPLARPWVRPVELSAQGSYDLAQPELADYSIVGSVQRGDCAVNPLFVFIQ